MLSKIANLLARAANPISRVINNIGLAVLAIMMFLTAVDVTLRYVFSRPITGSFELTQFMMVSLCALTFAQSQVAKANVAVDVVVNLFPKRVQAGFDAFAWFVGLVLVSLYCWRAFVRAKSLVAIGTTSPMLYIPIYPFVFVLAFGFGIMALVFLVDFINSLSQVVKKWNP